MIGNDVVDLEVAAKESNWKRPRFLQKIFTKEEQLFLDAAPDKNIAVWLLWSRKESAYKIIARLKKRRFFAPKKFESKNVNVDFVTPCLQNIGQVTFEEYTFFTKSRITENYIHTTAQLSNNKEPLAVNCFYINQNNYATQHQITQQYLFENYATLTNFSAKHLSIQKDVCKVPHLYYKNKKQMVLVSTSHHGHYGGFVLQSIPKK